MAQVTEQMLLSLCPAGALPIGDAVCLISD